MPEELVDKKYRLEKIKAAKKRMDEEKLKKANITDTDAKIMKHKDRKYKGNTGVQTERSAADAGYFSYDNVKFLLDEEIDAYIPDNFYEVEKRGETKKFRKSLFTYDEKKDCFYCPAAFEIPFTRIQKREDEPDLRYYVCKYCSLCVLKNACTESKNRTI
jgi:transposase